MAIVQGGYKTVNADAVVVMNGGRKAEIATPLFLLLKLLIFGVVGANSGNTM